MTYLRFGSVLLGFLLFACSAPSVREAGSPIRIRWSRDPETLDPLALSNQPAIDAANLLHVGLLQLDLATNTYAPALAAELPKRKLLGDSLSEFDYYLRPEATWDNGRPVLATDVAFTLKLMHCPGLPNEGVSAQIDFIQDYRLDAADARHITFVCKGQTLEYKWISGEFPVLCEAILDSAHALRAITLPELRRPQPAAAKQLATFAARYQQADIAHHPERAGGCGPYRLTHWETNRLLLFQRKPTWWADQLAHVPSVLQARARQLRYRIVPDAATAALTLRRRDLDVLANIPAPIFRQLQGSAAARRELAFYTGASYDMVTVGFNTARPSLHDRLTRQALSYLFDARTLLQATQQGQGVRTVGLLPPSSPYYNDSLPLLAYSPGRAAALLQQAGWQQQGGTWRRSAAARPLGLVFRYRAEDNLYTAIALQFRTAAARLNIEVELRPTDSSLMTQALRAGDFDLVAYTTKGNPFAYNFLPILHSRAIGEGNLTRFSMPVSDQLLTAITLEDRFVQRRRLLRRFQVLLREQAPLVPLFFLPYRIAASRQLRHFTASGLKPNFTAAALSWASTDTLTAAR